MKEKELNTEEMDQVSGGRTFIVYDKDGNEIRRVISEAIARMSAASVGGTYKLKK